MTEGNFVDYVKLYVSSGKGGQGSSHLHREKYVAKGGPDGGDGGRGGHVIVKGNKNLWTLFHFKFKKHFRAGHGEAGGKQRSSGAFGEDVYMEVPLGDRKGKAAKRRTMYRTYKCREWPGMAVANKNADRVAFFLGTFSWPSKKKYLAHEGRNKNYNLIN